MFTHTSSATEPGDRSLDEHLRGLRLGDVTEDELDVAAARPDRVRGLGRGHCVAVPAEHQVVARVRECDRDSRAETATRRR